MTNVFQHVSASSSESIPNFSASMSEMLLTNHISVCSKRTNTV